MIGAFDGTVDRLAIAQVGLDERDLADIAERLQMACKVRTANGNADAIAALGKRAHDMTADEPGSAENRHQRRKVGQGHGMCTPDRIGKN
ncbi:hypothetical protein D3C72_2085220 [compost metagenome]